MKRTIYHSLSVLFLGLALGACGGMRYLTIETQEPAKVTLPGNVRSVLIVNNTVQQPDNMGHLAQQSWQQKPTAVSVSTDSTAVYYTEALAQFLGEEEYFDDVAYYKEPLRNDTLYWEQVPIMPEEMKRLRNESGADALISLDKFLFATAKKQLFVQEGLRFAEMMGKAQVVLRIYQPSMDGQIPIVQYIDSLRWEGYDLKGMHDEYFLPSEKDMMKELAVHAAERACNALAPHWKTQDRWLYELPNKLMHKGMEFAEKADWANAIDKWTQFFNGQKNKLNKAKTASNIALAYEMQGDMAKANEWVSSAYDLFSQSATKSSFDMRRITLYKLEIERRVGNEALLSKQIH
ncbi:MAG: DUF6340 family protein [Dysgonamonadaceae bacterium]|nr:DUF6340 family protein [Dysgonamonadaceae bacterium]